MCAGWIYVSINANLALHDITSLPFCSPIESMADPPLSDPALPACSAGDVRRVDPSVAALLPISSSLPGADAVVSDRGPSSRDMAFWWMIRQYHNDTHTKYDILWNSFTESCVEITTWNFKWHLLKMFRLLHLEILYMHTVILSSLAGIMWKSNCEAYINCMHFLSLLKYDYGL